MEARTRSIGLLALSLLALLVGLITGVGAVAFRALIALIHNAAFLGKFAITIDANQSAAAPAPR
jgi:CIC family chloride channel protein